MSELLLERLSKKNTKKQKMKPMEIKLEKGQVQVEVAIIKADTDYDLTAFRQKLKNRGFKQYPQLTSTYNLTKNPCIFNC